MDLMERIQRTLRKVMRSERGEVTTAMILWLVFTFGGAAAAYWGITHRVGPKLNQQPARQDPVGFIDNWNQPQQPQPQPQQPQPQQPQSGGTTVIDETVYEPAPAPAAPAAPPVYVDPGTSYVPGGDTWDGGSSGTGGDGTGGHHGSGGGDISDPASSGSSGS